jgi:GNAT superfamily N-acetyltransferase
MENNYHVVFLDMLPELPRRATLQQIRKLQASMMLPIHKTFGDHRRRGALRSNFWDDLCELAARLDSGLGRTVVALSEGEVVGFLKAPIRAPVWVGKAACFLAVRSPELRKQLWLLFSTPELEIWCANSMGVVRQFQGRGLPRRMFSLSVTQLTRPTIVVTGHESANQASLHLHKSLGFTPFCRIKVLHLEFCVYLMLLNLSGTGQRFSGVARAEDKASA